MNLPQGAHDPAPSAEKRVVEPVRWRYRIESMEWGRMDWTMQFLNGLGYDGWEAVGGVGGQSILFKRRADWVDPISLDGGQTDG